MSETDEIARRLDALPDPDLTDPDNPEWTAEDFARARPLEEVLTPEELAMFRRSPGRPPLANRKRAISLRLDPDVLEAWRASGPGWQGRVNALLRQAMPKAG